MWVTYKEFEYFMDKCKFFGNMEKLIESLYIDSSEIMNGITYKRLNKKCKEIYKYFLETCPEGINFEEHILKKEPKISEELLKILLKLNAQNN